MHVMASTINLIETFSFYVGQMGGFDTANMYYICVHSLNVLIFGATHARFILFSRSFLFTCLLRFPSIISILPSGMSFLYFENSLGNLLSYHHSTPIVLKALNLSLFLIFGKCFLITNTKRFFGALVDATVLYRIIVVVVHRLNG